MNQAPCDFPFKFFAFGFQRGDIGAHQCLCAAGEGVERLGDHALAVIVKERRQTPFAEIERIQLADKVAVIRLRNPRVG